MAAITCDICGGTLSMDASGDFALCDACGTKHTKDRMKAKAQEITGTVEVSNIASLESLMKRGRLALEDRNTRAANEFFDKVLDINPEYAPAYVGKFCADLPSKPLKNDFFVYSIKKEEDLARYYKPFDDLDGRIKASYEKAIRFADETYRARLEGYNNEIKKRIEELKKEFTFFMVIESCFEIPEYGDYKDFYGISSKKLTGRKYWKISESTCYVGKIRAGVEFKILRTGICYQIGYYNDDYGVLQGGIESGDIAVITNEMQRLEKEKEEKARIQQQQYQQYRKVQQQKQERKDKQRREEEEQRQREEQQNKWASEGLCRYCGGKLSLFGKKCKSCGKEN